MASDVEMKPLNSTNLARAGYDPETQVLSVEFQNGDVYDYDAVPQTVFDGLFTASSPGQYFRNYIRGAYRYYKT